MLEFAKQGRHHGIVCGRCQALRHLGLAQALNLQPVTPNLGAPAQSAARHAGPRGRLGRGARAASRGR